jgi:hypothetical protein
MEKVGRELTEYEKGFLEALIDGEGCITLGRRTDRCRCWLPVLSWSG